MTAQEDDELWRWLTNAADMGGGFISSLAAAAIRADDFNYPILRPVLLTFRDKYPYYAESKSVIRRVKAMKKGDFSGQK